MKKEQKIEEPSFLDKFLEYEVGAVGLSTFSTIAFGTKERWLDGMETSEIYTARGASAIATICGTGFLYMYGRKVTHQACDELPFTVPEEVREFSWGTLYGAAYTRFIYDTSPFLLGTEPASDIEKCVGTLSGALLSGVCGPIFAWIIDTSKELTGYGTPRIPRIESFVETTTQATRAAIFAGAIALSAATCYVMGATTPEVNTSLINIEQPLEVLCGCESDIPQLPEYQLQSN